MALKLYIVAAYAMNPDSDDPKGLAEITESNRQIVFATTLNALTTFAHTKEEAEETVRTALLRSCPPEEGWRNHAVAVEECPREHLLKALEEATPEPGGETPDGSGLIM